MGELQLHPVHLEELAELLHERVLRLREDVDERFLVELVERRDHRKAAHELRDEPRSDQILGLDLRQQLTDALLAACSITSAPKPRVFCPVRRSMIWSRPTKAPPQMNRMLVVVDLQEVLLRVLAPALRGHVSRWCPR